MRIRRDAKKYAIIPSIKRYMKYHDILRDYETEEQMPTYYRFEHLDCLDDFIDKESYDTFLINMAIMYVNQGLLHAKHKLSNEEFKNYLIYFAVRCDDEYLELSGHQDTQVFFSRKRSGILTEDWLGKPIALEDTEIYDKVKDIIGINDFACYKNTFKNNDEVLTWYNFIPKCFLETKQS